MNTTLAEYVNLKRKVEQAQQIADKAEGAMEQVMKQLENEFECSTLKEAEEKLRELKKREAVTKRKFEDAIEGFEEKWKDKLDEHTRNEEEG